MILALPLRFVAALSSFMALVNLPDERGRAEARSVPPVVCLSTENKVPWLKLLIP